MKLRDDPRTALYIVFLLTFAIAIKLSIVHIGIALITAIYLSTQGLKKRALVDFMIYLLLFFISYNLYNIEVKSFKNFQFILVMILRLFPVIMSLAVVNSFSPRKITAALSKIHFPKNLIFAFLIIVRFIPTLKEEFKNILDAMHLRRLSLRSGYGFLHPFKTIRNILVPLLFRCLQISEELGYAAMSRGVDAPFDRSETESSKLKFIDFFLVILFTIIIISGFLIKTDIFEIQFFD